MSLTRNKPESLCGRGKKAGTWSINYSKYLAVMSNEMPELQKKRISLHQEKPTVGFAPNVTQTPHAYRPCLETTGNYIFWQFCNNCRWIERFYKRIMKITYTATHFILISLTWLHDDTNKECPSHLLLPPLWLQPSYQAARFASKLNSASLGRLFNASPPASCKQTQ